MPDSSKTFGTLTIPLLVLLAISFSAAPAHAKYGGGKGEPNDPYQIGDANHMQAIGADSNDWDKHFILMDDIDLSAFTGTAFNIIANFTGVFDGNDHTISNFTYTSTDTDSIGLFGYVRGVIKDLGLIDPNVDAGTGSLVGALVGYLRYDGVITWCWAKGCKVLGRDYVGGLVGDNVRGIITNCYATGGVIGNRCVGGLLGWNENGSVWSDVNIYNCYSTGSVSGFSSVGGIVGCNYTGGISYCFFTGSVSGNNIDVGGLVGSNGGDIFNSYSQSKVSGDYRYVGGLAGKNYGDISNCYSTGTILGYDDVGGLIGSNFSSISNCYSTCVVEGNNRTGGLVGDNRGDIYNCYSTGSVLEKDSVGGLVGENSYGLAITNYGVVHNSYWDIETSGQESSDGGEGKTTTQMQTASTFIGWGCGDVWTIDEGSDYPRLPWENKPGEPIINPSYWQGAGTEQDPYLVYTAEQLNTIGLIRCVWGESFKLMADIDLASFTGTEFNIIGNSYMAFTGLFDGNGHTISNFSYDNYNTPEADYIGLFGSIRDPNAMVKNLGLISPNVDARSGYYVGSLAGCMIKGVISGCYSNGGSVSGRSEIGGLIGLLAHHFDEIATITNCYATSSVSGQYVVGGLVGHMEGATVANCYSVGSVSGDWVIGGLIGEGIRAYGDYTNRVVNSFWDIETSGQTTSAGGTGLPTAETQTESTFTDADWDFSTPIWKMNCEGMSYPKLSWWQPVLGDFGCPDGIDMRDFAVLAAQWRQPPAEPSADIAPDGGNGIVDWFDLAALVENWLTGF